MGIEEGTILIKNGIRNNYTDRFNMREGDKFVLVEFVSRLNDSISVECMKDGITYVMYAMHFRDSNGVFTKDCMWR